MLASGCDDGTVLCWDVETGDAYFEGRKHTRQITHVTWNPVMPEALVPEDAIYWATKSLHITTVVYPSMSALTHKVDPDEPVSNLIAVVHRRLEPSTTTLAIRSSSSATPRS